MNYQKRDNQGHCHRKTVHSVILKLKYHVTIHVGLYV